MSSRTAVVPDDDHLDRYLEYPRRAHSQMKAVFVEAMEDGLTVHIEHDLPSMCIFQGTEVLGSATPSSWSNGRRGEGPAGRRASGIDLQRPGAHLTVATIRP